MIEDSEESLLERAEAEDKKYNWLKAAKLYNQVAKSYMDKNLTDKAADVYFKEGDAYYYAADKAETADEYEEILRNGIYAREIASNLYRQIGNKPNELMCEAGIIGIEGHLASSIEEAKKMTHKAYELYLEASELYFKENDQENYRRALNWALIAIVGNFFLSSDPEEIEELYQKGTKLALKVWQLSKTTNNLQDLSEALAVELSLLNDSLYYKDINEDYQFKEYYNNFLLRCEESLKLVEGCDDLRILGYIYLVMGYVYYQFGSQFIEDEIEQRQYLDKGIDFLEKSLEFLKKGGEKSMIIMALCGLIFIAIASGRIDYLQKRIIKDLNEILELVKIYKNTYYPWYFVANYAFALYYATIAGWSFFTNTQRKSYAKKGIEFSQESLKKLAFGPSFPSAYLSLTMSHSVLVYLTSDKDKKEEHLKLMLQYAKKANEIGETYKGGFSRSAGYNALYRAYKTRGDVAEGEEERIKMLTIAAEASKKYIKYVMESLASMISAQMRLGLLYEEISNINMNTDTLLEAKEIFLQLIEQCLERGYQSYAAATYEYIARIEDRIGNHTISAQYYENAQNAYTETLKNIEYKLLKNRVNEKMNYAEAWNLIENAKAHHKKENHLKAKENYEKAYEILNVLPNFSYEALYYFAWAYQEEAELLSKQENHDKAIKQFELTKNIFNDAIKTMEKISNKSKNEIVVVRIEKLGKVAKLRIKYCSARVNVEKARILGKQGNYLAAAELFASAASLFRDVCNLFKIERERSELEAVYYLCRAWECMEFAEKYEEPERFSEAANLFIKASNLFSNSKLRFLASGNSTFCQALELGCKFDEAIESEIKAELYPKIKVMLRNAASTYDKGDFENGSNWALATSTYFDAAWHLIRADEEMNLDEKSRLLEVGSGLLKSTAELFSDAGYKEKEKEVLKRLGMVEKEEKIIFSALNSIKKPDISSSTVGIIAPVCSLETSQSPRLGEIQQITYEITDESRRVLIKRAESSIEEPKSAYKTDLTVPEVSVKKSIFLSYSTLDSDYFQIPTIVERLKIYPEIENVSFWEADSGENVVEFMEKTLGKSNVFVLFCSENSMKSEAVKGEWQAAYQIRKKGRIKIVPVYESDDNIPNLLMPMLNVKFTRDDFNGFIGTLYNEILR